MLKPKFRISDRVSINGSGFYRVVNIERHGAGNCGCCTSANEYFMYNIGGPVWVNEDQLFLIPSI